MNPFRPARATGIFFAAVLAAFVLFSASPTKAPADGGPLDRRVIFLGDSLTAGGQWTRLFPRPWIKNAGVPGDTTADVLERLDDVVRAEPDQVFIMAGINDLWAGAAGKTVVENHRRIVKRILAGSPRTRVYLQSLLPVNNELCGNRIDNREVVEINGRLRDLAGRLGVVFIDLYGPFSTPGGQLDPRYTRDGLHLTNGAYDIWKKALRPYIEP